MSFTSPPPPPPIPSGPPADSPGGPRRGPARGRLIAMAAAGTAVLAAGVAALFLLPGGDPAPVAASPSPMPPPPTATSAPPTPSDKPDLPYVVLEPGTCFDHPNLTKGLKKITVRPCDKPHDGEAIANVTVKEGFTHDSEIAASVREQCTAAGQRTAHRQGEGSRFYSYVLTPSAKLYRRGYREATCTLTASYSIGGKKLTAKLH
ncbi:septum formation family protein [Peterkaempfera bronchialis]|uniref:Septum formation-related domain-containing protein n=1 Tax=Peterkaempfera bronchialis TaxID=2126346 RepID=A0A345STJ2_9ACTN|nr:septum formation family protein [Peterkaempfera bronchialis]AXI77047.1 hypothetical protein C7M71_005885 [Peterkaempfera bronchialis]